MPFIRSESDHPPDSGDHSRLAALLCRWWGSPGLVGEGVGDGHVVVGVTGEGPGQVVNQVVVVPTQADQVRHECLSTVSSKNDVVGFVDAGGAPGEPAVPVPNLDTFT